MKVSKRNTGPFLLLAAGSALLAGCLGPSDADRVGTVRSDLVMLLEGKDTTSLIRHCPDELSDMKITMNSGRYTITPESLDELEEGLSELQDLFNAETIEITQERTDIDGDAARVSMTFRLRDTGWERLVPLRMDLEKRSGRWVLTGLNVFD